MNIIQERCYRMIVSLIIILLILILIYNYFFPPIPKRKKHYKYAILLGCPSHDDGTMCASQIKRCNLAIQAYRENRFDTLIISGSNVKNQYYECVEMNNYIQEIENIPVILEKRARNTYENFQYAKQLVKDEPILILTSQTHIKRACAIGKHFFKNYSGLWYKDLKPEHVFRECISRYYYIKIETLKKIRGHH